MTGPQTPPPRKRRRWVWLAASLALVLTLLVVAVAALPVFLNSSAGTRWLIQRANRVLAPSRLEVQSFAFSWFSTTRMTNFALYGANGKREVLAARANWDRTLAQILFDRPRYGTLLLEQGACDFRSLPPAPGSGSPVRLDIIDTLRPIIEHAKPQTDLTIVVADGTLELAGHRLSNPVKASKFDLKVHRAPLPAPLTYEIRLADGSGREAHELGLSGGVQLEGAERDLDLHVTGRRWPLSLALDASTVHLRFDGELEAHRAKGLWSTRGGTELQDLSATRVVDSAKPVKLDRIDASWVLGQEKQGTWAIRKLELTGAVGSLKAKGTASETGVKTHLDGDLDLAAILALVPNGAPSMAGYHVDRGRLKLGAEIETTAPNHEPTAGKEKAPGRIHLTGQVGLDQVALHDGGRKIEVGAMKLTIQILDVSLIRNQWQWSSTGHAIIAGLTASGPERSDAPLVLDKIDTSWDMAHDRSSWTVRKLGLTGAIGTLKASGTTNDAGTKAQLDADLDLPALLALLPGGDRAIGGYRLEKGRLVIVADATSDRSPKSAAPTVRPVSLHSGAERAKPGPIHERLRLSSQLALKEAILIKNEEPVSLGPIDIDIQGSYDPNADRIDLDEATAATAYGPFHVSGSLTDPGGRRLLAAEARFDPKWDEISELIARRIEPGARITGGAVTLSAKGPLTPDADQHLTIDQMAGHFQAPIRSLDIYGMKLGAVTLGARCEQGRFTVEPIETTLNGGQLALRPQLDYNQKTGLTLLLAKGSSLADAQVNDEVSSRVLVYVVPALAGATVVNGAVSATVDRFEMPLFGPADRTSTIEGQVVFQNVVFRPGALAGDIIDLVAPGRRPELWLDQPVQLAIHDRRVYQQGFSLPIPNIANVLTDARIRMEGSVGFDKSLDMQVNIGAHLPVVGLLDLDVPLEGTLTQPIVPKDKMRKSTEKLIREAIPEVGQGIFDMIQSIRERRRRERERDER